MGKLRPFPSTAPILSWVRAVVCSVCSEHVDEMDLYIRTSFTHNIATELERLFIDVPDTNSIWEEFSSNGQEHDLDEIDEVCIRGRQSQSVESDRSPPRSESGGSSPTTLPSTTTIPMSRARLLEILRMSERGRLKPKAAVTRPKPEVQVSLTLCPSGQVCLLSIRVIEPRETEPRFPWTHVPPEVDAC